MRHIRSGFTIIELLVSVGIITMLLAILLPVVNRSMEQSRLAKCVSNQHQVFAALHIFTQNNADVFPGSCGPMSSGGPGPGEAYVGIGQLTTLGSLRQTELEKTCRSAM